MADGFNCPYCEAYAHHFWPPTGIYQRSFQNLNEFLRVSICRRCEKYSVWVNGRLVEPPTSAAPIPHKEMPPDVKALYEEGRTVLGPSPRAAAALLRLAIQQLLPHLGQHGININDEIAALVREGLPVRIQQSLDIVRVVGNNAVHPGEIQLDDNPEVASALFGLLNIIVETLIAEPKRIEALYASLPEAAREAINKRDKKS